MQELTQETEQETVQIKQEHNKNSNLDMTKLKSSVATINDEGIIKFPSQCDLYTTKKHNSLVVLMENNPWDIKVYSFYFSQWWQVQAYC